MALILNHQTKVQYLKRLRDRYKEAVKIEACRLAYKMLRHLSDGDVSQANMLNAWNMTADEWAVKAVKLQARADKWAAYKAAENAADNEGVD
jgi:hypothetical protein